MYNILYLTFVMFYQFCFSNTVSAFNIRLMTVLLSFTLLPTNSCVNLSHPCFSQSVLQVNCNCVLGIKGKYDFSY